MNSYKVKRMRWNPRAICCLGDKEGPHIPGAAEIVMGRNAIWRVYRAYWKTHPAIMALIAVSFSPTLYVAIRRGDWYNHHLENGGVIEKVQAIAAHESPGTTNRTQDQLMLDEIEKIVI